jgi:serine/threonine protein kinase
MNDLLEGFTIMRQRKILHQDIKPANIMFAANGTVKIIDFNVNITINDVEASEITQNVFVQGTRNWMSPEMLKAHLNQVSGGPARAQIKPGKSDIFSLGLVFLNLFTFDDLGGKNLEENNQSLLDLVRAKVDHEGCQNLMLKMLNKDPSKRPSFNKALAEMPGKTTRNN